MIVFILLAVFRSVQLMIYIIYTYNYKEKLIKKTGTGCNNNIIMVHTDPCVYKILWRAFYLCSSESLHEVKLLNILGSARKCGHLVLSIQYIKNP